MKGIELDGILPGDRVTISRQIDGDVTALQISRDSLGGLYVSQIQVAWWDGRRRECQWLEPWEVQLADDSEPMGFMYYAPPEHKGG